MLEMKEEPRAMFSAVKILLMLSTEYPSYLPTSKAMAFLFKILIQMYPLSIDRVIWIYAYFGISWRKHLSLGVSGHGKLVPGDIFCQFVEKSIAAIPQERKRTTTRSTLGRITYFITQHLLLFDFGSIQHLSFHWHTWTLYTTSRACMTRQPSTWFLSPSFRSLIAKCSFKIPWKPKKLQTICRYVGKQAGMIFLRSTRHN